MRNKMDACCEEDEQVFVHPRDPYHPYHRGEVVAETERPKILFETGLPPRYYIPPEDVRSKALLKSEKATQRPYKGTASYYSVEAGGRACGGPRLVLPGAAAGGGEDTGAPELLQREGGPRGGSRGGSRGGRRGAGQAADAVVVGPRRIR